MRIGLLSSTLEGGGAARVMVNMANHWHREGHAIELYSFESGEAPSFYPVDQGVSIRYLDLMKQSGSFIASIRNNWERLHRIRKTVTAFAPDALISFIDTANVRTLVSMLGSGIPVIVSERIHPEHEDIGPLWSGLRLLTYPLARRVVVQTKDAGHYFPNFLQGRISVIPNPVMLPPGEGPCPQLPQQSILAVGRLYPQKGYEMLLNAFAHVASSHPDWNLCIAGTGPLESRLREQAGSLGLGERVRFLGQVENVMETLKQAEIYVMSSTYEGFPNALCEAMATGLPCVSTDCPSGPADIITHEHDGLLVPNRDPQAMAEALTRLMESPRLRQTLAANARSLPERYSESRIMTMWETCIPQQEAQ